MLNLLRASNKKRLITIGIGLLAIVVTAFVLLLPKEKEEKTISQINLKQQNNYNAVATVNGTSWYYDLDKDGNAINVYYKEGELGENVIIPQTLDGHTVVKIEYKEGYNYKNIFGDKSSSIKTVLIPKEVTSIGSDAFIGCSSLTSINIPYGVTSIESFAFSGCSSLTSIKIPEGVTTIGQNAFYKCSSLTNINIPEGVTSIGYEAFRWCSSLTSIEIPSSVTNIGGEAFSGCSSLISLEVDENNQNYCSENGVLYNKNKTKLIKCVEKKEGKVIIPEGVTSIGREAFSGCSSLTSIEVDEENQYYCSQNGVLYNKNKTELIKCVEKKEGEVIIPEGVTTIGSYAFYNCISLTSINIPEGVTSIGGGAFKDCSSLTSIEIPSSVTKIGDGAFYGCRSLTSINIPEGVTSIGYFEFLECSSLTNIEIPSSVTSIQNQAFYGCSSLTSINILEGVTSIGSSAFDGCSSLTSINIPEGVTSIGAYAFYECISLTSINIPETVTSIGSSAFDGCSSLTSINIPETVTSIENDAFNGCKITLAVANNDMEILEIELPEIIKRSQVEGDILYSDQKLTLNNCEISEDGNKLKIYTENEVTLKVNSGVLEELEIEIVPSGTITYSDEYWTEKNVIAILHIAEGESIKENDEGNIHTFTENGEFTFKYLDTNNEEKEVVAKVENIDKQAPIIKSVEGNPTEWTKENVTIKINAEDNLSGLVYNAYSFDGGETWQKENEKTYTENASNIVIKVRDNAGNLAEYEPISITKIIKLTEIKVTNEPTKKSYIEGENFDKTGMVVTASYNDGTSKLVTNYTVTDGNNLTVGKETVEISYTDSETGVTKTTTIPITVVAKELSSIALTNQPTKKSYIEGEKFDRTGMVVTATYNNGRNNEVTNYTIEGENDLQVDTTSLAISYTENGVTKTTTVEGITVTKKVEELHAEFEGFEEKEEENIKYIEKIMPETKIETLKSKITTNGTIIEIYNNKNEKITNENELIATGMEIIIKLEDQEQRYTAVVKGDLSGDGKISIGDLLKLARYEAKIDTNLTGAYLRASDVAGKGQYGGISNLIKMSRIIAGMDNL